MENKNKRINSPNTKGGTFKIRVQGQLDPSWADWLEGLELEMLENGEMILCGYIPDQAALIGVLNKLSRLNLTVRSVNQRNEDNVLEEK